MYNYLIVQLYFCTAFYFEKLYKCAMHNCKNVQMYNWTTVHQYNCTSVQLYICTTVQLYKCSDVQLYTVQLYNCTTVQLYNCTTVQLYIWNAVQCTMFPLFLYQCWTDWFRYNRLIRKFIYIFIYWLIDC